MSARETAEMNVAACSVVQEPLIRALRVVVGRRHVLTGVARTRRFTTGYRSGEGSALAVVRPGSLVEL